MGIKPYLRAYAQTASERPVRASPMAAASSDKTLEQAKSRAKAYWDKELAKSHGSKAYMGMLQKNQGQAYWQSSVQYSASVVNSETNYDLKVAGNADQHKINFSPIPYR